MKKTPHSIQDAKFLIQREAALKSERATLEAHWQEIADFFQPNKNNVTTRTTVQGEKKGVSPMLYDSTGIASVDYLSGALHGILTNPATLWFDLITGDEETDNDDDAREWLQKTTRLAHQILNNSNFQTEIHEVYLDLTSFGTAPYFIEEDEERIVRFQARSIAECVIDENNKGLIDTVFRTFKWTARQIVQEFGEEGLPEKIKKAYEKGQSERFEIMHAVFPRDEKQKKTKAGPLSYDFASTYILKDSGHVLKEGGYREFPCPVPRWSKVTGEIYGRSPAMSALADVKMLNQMMKATIEGAQMTIRPPLMVPNDGFMHPILQTPAGLIYYEAGTTDRIEPLITDARIDFGYQAMDDVRQRVRRAFYIDQLQLQNGPQMTAAEVMKRSEDQLRLMGPVVGRQYSENGQPMLQRLFGIMARKNKLPQPVPKILQGKPIQLVYSSQIAKAQRATEGDNLMRIAQAIAPAVQANPQAVDNIDGDAWIRLAIRAYGGPQEILHDKKVVEETRKGRAEAQAQAAQMQQAQATADVAATAAPAVQAMNEMNAPEEFA